MSDLHERIVDGDDVVVDRHAGRADEDKVTHRIACKLHVAAHDVVETQRRVGHRQTHGEALVRGGPGFGFEHFKQLDFLADKEVVLTFDDGPWPVNTPAVLKALADQCTKGLFFPIGKHATYHPEILRQVAAAGHTIGAHTWSHANLNSKKITDQQAKDEIEKGFSAVKLALGTAPSPFFRFPELQHGPAAVAYLGTRNIAVFSCDLDSFDFRKNSTPDKVVQTVMTKLDKLGKGIILMHDFQKHTADALPELLRQLKAGGFKVVQIKAKTPMQTLAEYDELVAKDAKVPVATARPVNSVVQTVSQ